MNKLSDVAKRGIETTWEAIASDVGGVDDNEIAVEICIDANRVSMFAGEAAEKEIKEYMSQFDEYFEALKAISEQVTLVW